MAPNPRHARDRDTRREPPPHIIGGVQQGSVERIYVKSAKGERPEPRDRVRAVALQGLEGDWHFGMQDDVEGRNLTLIEAEAIEGLARDTGIELEPWEPRRNVVVRGVDLNALVGRRFRVGAVECVGRIRNEPCRYLERMTQPGVLKGLVGRGGLRADVVTDGEIAVGDELVELDESA
jgi:MOSC domain-containing protein YiiM